MQQRRKLVIIGAGFAGINASRALRNDDIDITIIDQNNYHTFQPLLYQVATAQLDAEETARSIRATFRKQRNLDFHMARVTGIDWTTHEVLTDDGKGIGFDYLLQAAGSVYNHFGIPGVAEHAFFLKTLTEAVNLRSHILRQFELAASRPHEVPPGTLNFVIVGGGPTGVEMAGALLELFERVLPGDYPHLDVSQAQVHLVETLPHLLAPYTERSRDYTRRVLEKRGAKLHLGASVVNVSASEAALADGTILPTNTLIWAAGVRGSPLAQDLGMELGRGFRVRVEDDLSLPGQPDVFAAGDVVGAVGADEQIYPQVAQVAIQQGRFAARQIRRRMQGLPGESFRYVDKGTMAIIGRNAGVAELSRSMGGLRFKGFLGWLAWLFIHLIYLPGHRNRFFAMITWAVGYLTFDRHARLISEMVPSPGDSESRRK